MGRTVGTLNDLARDVGEVRLLWEMATEAGDESLSAEIEQGLQRSATARRSLRGEGGALRTSRQEERDPVHSSGRRRHGVPGLGADAHAHVLALGGARRLQGRGRRPARGRGGGHQVRHHRDERGVRLRVSEGGDRRPPADPHLPVRRVQAPAHVLRLGGGDPGGRGRRGDGQGRRSSRGRVPVVGPGRPGRQYCRLGGAHHAPAERDRGRLPERALPAQEPRHGHADPPRAACSPSTRRSRRRSSPS